MNEVGLLVVEEASTTTWNPDQGSDSRQQVRVVAQVSSHRESGGRVARRQARQERVESAAPGEREVNRPDVTGPFKRQVICSRRPVRDHAEFLVILWLWQMVLTCKLISVKL
ncbi:hypothetical protein Pcinc_003885 [Petrolisthes cinctipes]|uniref:Uncharacterized protein n=1 Tax=Petrolisthes cinctipes TaxID=88211 RepID=A0AAE1GIE4_PETCI|nr:hypothetical protein Pcinc_003885 [Petrolisthes cinctipes]